MNLTKYQASISKSALRQVADNFVDAWAALGLMIKELPEQAISDAVT